MNEFTGTLAPGLKQIGVTEITKAQQVVEVSANVAEIEKRAKAVSDAYETYDVMSFFDSNLVNLSPKGQALFSSVNKEIFQCFENMRVAPENATMEDWRSLPWETILPEEVETEAICNMAIYTMWIFLYT